MYEQKTLDAAVKIAEIIAGFSDYERGELICLVGDKMTELGHLWTGEVLKDAGIDHCVNL